MNDFSAAQNYALEKSTGDWNLVLDADEYIMNDCRSIDDV
jgi:glycosyltransferase involved in cell wall biosynthesis